LREGKDRMIKYVKAFITYLKLLKCLKDDDSISGLYRLKVATESMIKRLEEKKTTIERILPEIEGILLRHNIDKCDLIKALKSR
jgi:NurA-like 5'-3' nuclease